MTIKKENRLWLIVLISLIAFYFGWLLIFENQEFIRTIGGNIFAILGALIPSIWLLGGIKRSTTTEEKIYWLLLFNGTFSYLLAEICWFYIETILSVEITFTGIYDLFYIGSVLFYFIAFMYKILKNKNKYILITFLFDIAIIMIVSVSLSWDYILVPLIEQGDVSLLALSITLFYPISDLLLLFCVSAFYFGGENFFKKRTLFYILIGLGLQICADTLYLFESAQETYFSGNWTDPLFIIPIMVIGYTALIERESNKDNSHVMSKINVQAPSIFRLVFPYLLVVFMFIFLIVHSNTHTNSNIHPINPISIGLGLSILLIILRQFIVIFQNQSLLKQYHEKTEELEISEERYRSLFEYHPDSVFSLDLEGKIESINAAGATLLGKDQKNLLGSSITAFIDRKHQEEVADIYSKVKEGWVNSHEFTIKNKDDKNLWIDMTHIPILVRHKLVGIFGIGRDVTEKKLTEEKIRFYAYHDYLTGLGNRRLFEEKLQQLTQCSEKDNKKFGLIFIDLNKFKQINDVYGHEAGDQLLSAIADRIKSFIGEQDVAARMGGDEFTILLQNIAPHNVQEEILELSKLLNGTYSISNIELESTSSIGFAYYPLDGKTPTELLSKADNAMYRVKKSRK